MWRLAANLVVLLAFALQSYVTQTHFHPETLAFDAAPAAKAVPHASAYNPALGGDQEKVCPLCQMVASAGAFFLPGPPLVLALAACAVVISRLAAAGSPRAAAPAGFARGSRAPPQTRSSTSRTADGRPPAGSDIASIQGALGQVRLRLLPG
jgi:hypothetical protein